MSNKLKSKSPLTANEKRAQELIGKEVAKALHLLQSHLKTFTETTGGPSIPYVYIESSIKILLENYNNGIKSQSDQSVPNKDDSQSGRGTSTIS